MTLTREDQINAAAPSVTGETGYFNVISADTLRRGDWSFGVYLNDYDLYAAPARAFDVPSARSRRDMSYDLYQLNGSLGYGLTDRWEITASLPWDRIQNHGGDRAGYVNGYLYQGRFSESGLGDLHLATKFGLTPTDAPSRLALSISVLL